MIFSGVIAAAFLYFIIAFLHISWEVYAAFVAAEVISIVFHKRGHFKTSQITFIFLYLIVLLLWSKQAIFLSPQFIYLLSSAVIFFTLSDISWKLFFKIIAWTLIGVTIFLLMYERFGSLILAIVVGLLVIPVALMDREHVKDKNRAI